MNNNQTDRLDSLKSMTKILASTKDEDQKNPRPEIGKKGGKGPKW